MDSQMNESLPDALFSIKRYLQPTWLEPTRIAIVRERLSSGAVVVVRDACHPMYAERMFQCLNECTAWKVYEGGSENFHYHHHNLTDKSDYPKDLKWCERVFSSSQSRDFAAKLSGRSCGGS